MKVLAVLFEAWQKNRQIFVFGNGGSAANASHFAVDLAKTASRALWRPFRVMSLNDNVPWLTALANDYAYQDIFQQQLRTFAQAGDVAMALSVSGNSPNCVQALCWAKAHELKTVAIVGANQGDLVDHAHFPVIMNDSHFGRAEDGMMTFLHMLCYAFAENTKEDPGAVSDSLYREGN